MKGEIIKEYGKMAGVAAIVSVVLITVYHFTAKTPLEKWQSKMAAKKDKKESNKA